MNKLITWKVVCPNADCPTNINRFNKMKAIRVPEGTPSYRCLHCKTSIPLEED